MTEDIGLLSSILDKAQDIAENGVDCDRCGETQRTPKELMGVMAFTAHSPVMENPSPPSLLCLKCSYLTAAFMGIKAAKKICEERGYE